MPDPPFVQPRMRHATCGLDGSREEPLALLSMQSSNARAVKRCCAPPAIESSALRIAGSSLPLSASVHGGPVSVLPS